MPGGRHEVTGSPSARAAVERAVRGDGLRTAFQPIVDLHRLVVTGYEALARFDVPGVAGPEEVIVAAGERGVLADLEAQCLRSALQARPHLPPNCFLTLNVEPDSVGAPAVADVLGAEPHLRGVVIEVTERRGGDDPAAFVAALDRWREAGARVAVDDAGAGHSGLQKILAIRPDILKLDASLVRGIDADEAKAALVEMFGTFAGRIDAWLLAEGVETEAEARRLAALGVPLAQGRFFGGAADRWAELDDHVRSLRPAARASATPLLRLIEDAPCVPAGAEAGVDPGALTSPPGVVVVVDPYGSPVGLLVGAGDGGAAVEARPPLRVNERTGLADVAHRVATRRPPDTGTPVVVHDDVGRYVGVVGVARLLRALATAAEGTATEPG